MNGKGRELNVHMVKKGILFCIIAVVVVLAACSNNNGGSEDTNGSSQQAAESSDTNTATNGEQTDADASTPAETTYPVTVSNYTTENGTWVKKDQTFDKAPERVVANTQGAAELMIRLGLTDKLVGVAALFGSVPDDIADEFKKFLCWLKAM